MSPVALLVVVVTYNSGDVIESCLGALPAALVGIPSCTVVIADNDSSDDTVVRARLVRPSVRVVHTGGNLGYAAALNKAVATVPDHERVLVLNPDVTPAPGSIVALADALDREGVGVVVPRLTDPSGQLAWSLRREPSLMTAIGEALLGGRISTRLDWGEKVTDPTRYREPATVDWATGAAVMIDRACWQRVGPWSESFLLYGEETEFMLRARDAGYRTRFVPASVMTHRGGESGTSPFLWSLMLVNKVSLYTQRHGRLTTVPYRCVLLVGECARAIVGRPRSRAAVRLLARPSRRPRALPS